MMYNSQQQQQQQQIGYASPAAHVGAYTPSVNAVQVCLIIVCLRVLHLANNRFIIVSRAMLLNRVLRQVCLLRLP